MIKTLQVLTWGQAEPFLALLRCSCHYSRAKIRNAWGSKGLDWKLCYRRLHLGPLEDLYFFRSRFKCLVWTSLSRHIGVPLSSSLGPLEVPYGLHNAKSIFKLGGWCDPHCCEQMAGTSGPQLCLEDAQCPSPALVVRSGSALAQSAFCPHHQLLFLLEGPEATRFSLLIWHLNFRTWETRICR